MCSRRNKVTITGVSGTGMEIASGWVSECWLTRQTPLCVSNLSKSLKRRGLLSFRSDGRDRLVTCCVPRNQFFSLLNRKKWTICWYSFVSLGFCLAIEKDRCNIRVKEIQSRRPFKGIVFFFRWSTRKLSTRVSKVVSNLIKKHPCIVDMLWPNSQIGPLATSMG